MASALLIACNKPPPEPRPSGPASMGLPPLSSFDGSVADPLLPDAAPVVAPDAAPDVGPDLRAPERDAAADAAAPALDGPEGEKPPPAPGEDAAICSATGATAKPVPVDIFVLMDRSGSMSTPVPGVIRDGGTYLTRWESVKEALTKFVNSPAAGGLQIGLGYFPPAALFGECDVMGYAMPAVPIAPLPGVASTFVMSINGTYPGGGTPMLPALQGAVQYAKQREMMTGRRTAIALATDGDPGGCLSSVAGVATEAMMAANNGIYTFVIGVGSSLTSFSTIATAGGTTAFLVDNATPDALAMAFKNVQTQAARLACSFMVPPPPPGEMLDPFKVAVSFTPVMTPAQAFGIPMVATKADCGSNGGWYFDDFLNPKTLTLCDASCQKVNGAGEGSVSLQFGCMAK